MLSATGLRLHASIEGWLSASGLEAAVCELDGRGQRQQRRGTAGGSAMMSLAALLTQHQHGLTHAFVVVFPSEEDRDYYVRHDPAHLAFVKSIATVVEKAQVLDFTPGEF
jgi:hypothetical protein